MTDRAHARHTDPSTSHAAAASVRELTPRQIAVRELFRQWGPMTDEQLVERYTLPRPIAFPQQSPSGIRTRRSELVARGDVVDTLTKGIMTTGRKAIIWGLSIDARKRAEMTEILTPRPGDVVLDASTGELTETPAASSLPFDPYSPPEADEVGGTSWRDPEQPHLFDPPPPAHRDH